MMKRSEVEKLIRDVIKAEESKTILKEPIEVKILDAILEVGMLAPTYIDRLGCGCCSNTVEGEWEQE